MSLLGDLSPSRVQCQQVVVVLVHVPQHQRVQMGLVKTAIQFGGSERESQHLHAAGLARAHVSTVFQSSIWHLALYVCQNLVCLLHNIVT
jgi:hypothetical protein